MSGLTLFKRIQHAGSVLAVTAALGMSLASEAQAVEKVTTYKDENGWKLQVDGQDYYIKGMVWGYTPRNENYTYNLWGESDDFVRKVLDYDFGLMKAGGVNTIRAFTTMPPRWVQYVFEQYGIRTVINPLMGRYGYSVAGKWHPFTDYSDELTRAVIKADTLAIIDQYKNTPGVLMFAFGNESNYGLSWKSYEIENLPEGERFAAKARFLYSLFNDVMAAGKKMDPNHPFSIVNGDIQYLDLIAEICTDMDVLGSNVYRGKSFTSLWEEVDDKLDLPVVFFEFGSDAFNAREFKEDQRAQATILRHQWLEMYSKSYGNGEEGNSIGGFVFEWRDEWWKYLQTENLDVHDNNASWANGGYPFDFVEGKNNMNEEWFGITALGTPNSEGVYTARVRMAYDVLAAIWAMDPYRTQKVAVTKSIENMDMDYLNLKSEVRLLNSEADERRKIVNFTGGRLEGELVLKGNENQLTESGENGNEYTDGQMIFLDFGFAPTDQIDGQFSLNVLGNVADKDAFEITYGRRGLPITVVTEEVDDLTGARVESTDTLTDRERVEIYDFDATYSGELVDITAFYHTPRFHWKYQGDFFGLISETTDIKGMDIWNAKAPEGVEIVGKGKLDGLKVVFGPEIYWGANPKVVLKYSSKLGRVDYTVMHSEDVARTGQSASATAATERETRQTTLYTKTALTDNITLEAGGIIASTEKVDDLYDRHEGDEVVLDDIEFEDTLGLKLKLSFPMFGSLAYVATHHAGLVADAGAPLIEFGSRLPYSGLGNKEEYEAGVMMNFGYWMVFPRVLVRNNLVDANPIIPTGIDDGILNPGLSPRNRDDDPFAVLGNREARSGELFVTWDPTGATPFYAWDNDWREDAAFAFNVGANYTEYPTATDSHLFFFEEGGFNGAFGVGLPAEDVWQVSSRMVFNPSNYARYIANFSVGFLQATGAPEGGTRKFYEMAGKAVLGRKHIISGYVKKDAWGPYDFHRQFNITYPEQVKLDYSVLLDSRRDELNSTKVGVRALYRSLDENSADIFDVGTNDYEFLSIFYFNYSY